MKKIFTIMTAAVMMTACSERKNPLLVEWNTPYGIPPFSEIKAEDYIPATEAGIEEQNREIEAIVNCQEEPTFENTIVAMEVSGETLSRVRGILFNLYETDRSEALDSVVEKVTAMITEHDDNIYFNKALYERVAKVYNADQSSLSREQQMVLKKTYEEFVMNGIGLPEEQQERLRQINTALAARTQKIGNNILAESNAFREKYGISVSDFPTAMTTTADRSQREAMYQSYTHRCHGGDDKDNTALVKEVLALRIEKAQILGYKNPAEHLLANKMAEKPETVDAFLSGIMEAAVARAREEVKDMQVEMDADIAAGVLPQGSKIEPWDWWYYAEKVRRKKYDLDEALTQPYFKLDNVVKGIFIAAKRLYGVEMEEIHDVPVYNAEVKTYKVKDADGTLLGIFTTDYMPRESKRGGAWMSNIREQYTDAQGKEVRPIIQNVGNLQEYLTIDMVGTVFHEFGHALHGLLTKCHYPSVSGTNVKRDFVEVFSQINENWAFQPSLLSEYALNDKGEVIPDSIVEKINKSMLFNQGFMTTELCAASILDMKLHELTSVDALDLDAFEQQVCREMGLIPEIGPRYRTHYFNHIWCSGYSAGYYGYLWAEVLDKDAFSLFEESGDVWNPILAKRFREEMLQRGGSEEPTILFRNFAGREPNNAAFLRARGLER